MKKQRFIDLFAGIGGFHIALHDSDWDCVFASEIDKYARETYYTNFKKIAPNLFKENNFNKDILTIKPEEIPDHEILCAGFPCQPFSQAGYKKGFQESHENRGNMFFVIRDIIKAKKPRAIFLENVQHLKNHDGGRTFSTIKKILREELKYKIRYDIIRASDYNLPQHRPRMYIIGFPIKDKYPYPFEFPEKQERKLTMSDVWGGDCDRDIGFTLRVGGRGSKINDRRNWDSYRVNNKIVRLGVEEGKKMMGLPKSFVFQVSETQAMKQLGNSVAVNAVKAVADQIKLYLKKKDHSPSFVQDKETLQLKIN